MTLAPAQQRNVLLLGADLALFMATLGLLGPVTLVPLFVSKVTDDPLAIGALSAAFHLGWLPQLFTAGWVERSPRKLPMALVFTGFERLPALGLALCALAATSITPGLLIALVLLCRFGQTAAGGLATTPWLDLVARVVPAERRGRFMGNTTMVGHLLGAGAAALAAPLLEWLGYPYGFAACFGLAFLILMLGWVPLFLIAEPLGGELRPARPFREELAELPAVLGRDRAFRRFLSGLSLAALGTMSTGFLVVYAVGRLGATDELAAWYTAVVLLAQVAANPGLGWLADRHGFSAVGQAAALAGVGLSAIALAAPDPLWLVAAFGMLGVGQAGTMLARLTGPMEFAPPDRRPTYVALSSALVSLVAAAAPLIGGQIIVQLGYGWLFVASAGFSLAGAIVLRPHARP